MRSSSGDVSMMKSVSGVMVYRHVFMPSSVPAPSGM